MFDADVYDCTIHITRPVTIDQQFTFMFQGKKTLQRGYYYYHYKMDNYSVSRLVNKFSRIYGIKIDYTFARNRIGREEP